MLHADRTKADETTMALILGVREFREADLMVSFLDEEGTLSRGMAKNARKSLKRFANCFEPLSLVTLSLRRQSSRVTVRDAQLREGFLPIRRTPLLSGLGAVIGEMLMRCMPENDPHGESFPLAVGALRRLCIPHVDPLLVTAVFIVRLMTVAGYCPSFDRCGLCGGSLDAVERWVWQLAPLRCVCAVHHLGGSLKWEWDRETLEFLRAARAVELEGLWNLHLSPSKRPMLFANLCRWCETIIQGEVKSYRWLQKVAGVV